MRLNRAIQVIFLIFSFALPSLAAERYIIPIWGLFVRGANVSYTGAVALTNLSDKAATVTVTKIVPIKDEVCVINCNIGQAELPPYSTTVISDSKFTHNGRGLLYGAVEIESDQPLHVTNEIFSTEGDLFTGSVVPKSWQSVEIARDWITGASIIPRAIPESGGTFRLYLINPNDFPIRFDYRSPYGKAGSAVVSADSITIVDLDSTFLGAVGGAEHPIGMGFSVFVNADFPYLAAAVSKSPTLSPDVRIAHPLAKGQ